MQTLSLWAKSNGLRHNSPEAQSRLTDAYQRLFSHNATEEDRDIALVDLAVFTRFYEVMSPTASEDGLRHAEGRRAVMRLITGFVADPRVLGELQIAALQEAIVQQGT